MAFFDKMIDSISIAGQEVSQKAKAATENVRIGNMIKANERMIEKLTYQVGAQCVEKYVNDPDSEYKELFAEILRLRKENMDYQAELQQASQVNVCAKCGFNNNMTAKFCTSCGAPLPAPMAKGRQCPKCGFMNEDDALFCVECGSPIQEKEGKESGEESEGEGMAAVNLCKNCGAELAKDSIFCTTCGMKCE